MIRQLSLLAMLALVFPLMAQAQQQYLPGQHFGVLEQPVRTRDASKIEVVEVFAYTCGHCYRFDPLASQWKKSLADDVDFHLIPAPWGGALGELYAQTYYAGKALGVAEKMHQPLFNELVVKRQPNKPPAIQSREQMASFFAANGVDRDKFLKAFDSFGVKSQVAQGKSRVLGYKVTGTPELVVNGKYLVSARMPQGQGQSHAEMLKVVDFLIAKERAAKASAE